MVSIVQYSITKQSTSSLSAVLLLCGTSSELPCRRTEHYIPSNKLCVSLKAHACKCKHFYMMFRGDERLNEKCLGTKLTYYSHVSIVKSVGGF